VGKHGRRATDSNGEPEFGQAGTPGEVRRFDDNVGRHVTDAADKRLTGQMPYDQEPGSKPTINPDNGKRRKN
jgi:hypothetical protein